MNSNRGDVSSCSVLNCNVIRVRRENDDDDLFQQEEERSNLNPILFIDQTETGWRCGIPLLYVYATWLTGNLIKLNTLRRANALSPPV